MTQSIRERKKQLQEELRELTNQELEEQEAKDKEASKEYEGRAFIYKNSFGDPERESWPIYSIVKDGEIHIYEIDALNKFIYEVRDSIVARGRPSFFLRKEIPIERCKEEIQKLLDFVRKPDTL